MLTFTSLYFTLRRITYILVYLFSILQINFDPFLVPGLT